MQKNGFVLSSEETSLMKKVASLKSLADFCQGCIQFGKEKISTILKKKSVELYYDWYLKAGYADLLK